MKSNNNLNEDSSNPMLSKEGSSKPNSNNDDDQFIVDDFEKHAEDFAQLTLSDNTNVKDGKVIGPRHVLVYDTTLRGMFFYLFCFEETTLK